MGVELSKLRGGDAERRDSQEIPAQYPAPETISGLPESEPRKDASVPSQADADEVSNVPAAQGPAFDWVTTPSLNKDLSLSTQERQNNVAEDNSLSSHRARVQQLRAEQASESTENDTLRAGMESAGMLDQHENTEESSTELSAESESAESDEDAIPHAVLDANDPEDGTGSNEPPVTKNEIIDEEIPIPSISQVSSEELPLLQHIGTVHSIVDSVVIVAQTEESLDGAPTKARDFDVLDSGSLLCTAEGRVVGLVYETFGSVQHPFYSIRYPSADAIDRDLIKTGLSIYYLPTCSTYVLAQAIRTKGSDASNIWDEEVAEDEAEFSDDEEEAAAKRRAKQERQAKANGSTLSPTASAAEMDPLEASLGPLGGYPASSDPASMRGRKRKDKARRGRGGHFGEAKRGRTYNGTPSAPHINPRFAGQWMPNAPFGMPVMPPFPQSFGMPSPDLFRADPYGAYSPNHSQIDLRQSSTYDPQAPMLSSGPNPEDPPSN